MCFMFSMAFEVDRVLGISNTALPFTNFITGCIVVLAWPAVASSLSEELSGCSTISLADSSRAFSTLASAFLSLLRLSSLPPPLSGSPDLVSEIMSTMVRESDYDSFNFFSFLVNRFSGTLAT